jgi:hypothetical protein
MPEAVWVFARGQEVLRVVRGDDPLELTVIRPDGERQDYTGYTEAELGRIHAALEAELRHEGWTLEQFTPERRERLDRRKATRSSADRRRP